MLIYPVFLRQCAEGKSFPMFTILVMGKIGGKSQNSVHPVITYQTLLIASSWSSFFWGLQDLVPSSFSGIPYLSGKKACIVLKKTGLGLFQVLLSASCINQENHFTATTHFIISPYLAG